MIDEARESAIERVARWAGLTLTEHMLRRLAAFEDWLGDEAIPAGGLGPQESNRVGRRHVGDSLSFAGPFRAMAPKSLVDLGSGVGLPGIPLAIALPHVRVTLVDRGGRRTDLAERAVRVVGLDNVEVVQGDLGQPIARFDGVTMRAVLPPVEAVGAVRSWLGSDGLGVIGLSHGSVPPVETPSGPGLDLVAVPPDVLDSPGWLLTIRP